MPLQWWGPCISKSGRTTVSASQKPSPSKSLPLLPDSDRLSHQFAVYHNGEEILSPIVVSGSDGLLGVSPGQLQHGSQDLLNPLLQQRAPVSGGQPPGSNQFIDMTFT